MNANEPILPGPACERDLIALVERLWEIECRHLLGSIPTAEYRQEVAALLHERGVAAERRTRKRNGRAETPCADRRPFFAQAMDAA